MRRYRVLSCHSHYAHCLQRSPPSFDPSLQGVAEPTNERLVNVSEAVCFASDSILAYALPQNSSTSSHMREGRAKAHPTRERRKCHFEPSNVVRNKRTWPLARRQSPNGAMSRERQLEEKFIPYFDESKAHSHRSPCSSPSVFSIDHSPDTLPPAHSPLGRRRHEDLRECARSSSAGHEVQVRRVRKLSGRQDHKNS